MAKTWADLKTETLQLMFSASDSAASNKEYIDAMKAAANYALRDLANVCRPIIKRYGISHNPVPNMLGDAKDQFEIVQVAGDEKIYTAMDPKAFYLEVDNPCTVNLEQVLADGTVLALRTMENKSRRQFTAYNGLITVAGSIRLHFVAGTLYNLRNVAFYAVPFPTEADIPPFTRYDRYDLKDLTRSPSGAVQFMRLVPNSVVSVGSNAYSRSDDFYWESDSVIVFDHYAAAQFDILYQAYPAEITADTDDDYEPELSPEALDIVPLYMAGRLYMDDDAGIATGYRNQYSAQRSELSMDTPSLGASEWNSESGWF